MQPNGNPSGYQQLPNPPQGGLSPDYGFILDSTKPKKRVINLPTNSLPSRLLLLTAGLLILIILFVVIKGLLTTQPFSKADYISVIQQQQEISHILVTDLGSNSQQTNLSTSSNNFAVTTQLSISSAQAQMTTYLKNNGIKVSPAELSLKVNTTTDGELTNALTTNNFNQVFDQVMQQELQTYEQNLTAAYKTSHGPKGRALLKSEYAGAQLLIKQINLPTS